MKRITSLTAITLCILATTISGASRTLTMSPVGEFEDELAHLAIARGMGCGGPSPSPRRPGITPGDAAFSRPSTGEPTPGLPVTTPCYTPTASTPRGKLATIHEYDITTDRTQNADLNFVLARIKLCDKMIDYSAPFV